ncbi:AGAP013381-PA-like protein [Anopheles sinensis]|uniref:AGAP013381-PA-like protein n=1 Tax=Anopheles sinensis TaxID=74873 RepID=A0A084WPS0_ANOSI|nr:AGAP013381-PA-like protein [Anopheles sinensis]
MDDKFYESKAYMNDGFTHGYYWKTGKLEIHTEKLLPQGFEVNMNHHHQLGGGYDPSGSGVGGGGSDLMNGSSTAKANMDTTGGGGGGGGYWGRAGDSTPGTGLTGTLAGLKGKMGMFDYGAGDTVGGGHDLGYDYDGGGGGLYRPGTTYLPSTGGGSQPDVTNGSSLPNGVGMRTGRKLPNPTRNGKRQLPQPQKSSSVHGSADFRLKSPTVRKLPIPQRNLKSVGGPQQPPLLDNFNIDLSVKAFITPCHITNTHTLKYPPHGQ